MDEQAENDVEFFLELEQQCQFFFVFICSAKQFQIEIENILLHLCHVIEVSVTGFSGKRDEFQLPSSHQQERLNRVSVSIETRKSMAAGCSIVQSQESTIRIINSILQGQAQGRVMLQLNESYAQTELPYCDRR